MDKIRASHRSFLPNAARRAWRAAFIAATLAAIAGLAQAQDAAAPSSCPALLQRQMPRLQDEKPQDLCQYAGKVLLVVNTASRCGFTKQYAGLEALYAKYKARGLVVLGFPSNDFAQELGSNKEVAAFCENTFGVKFPMFAKSQVSGSGPALNPLFADLAQRSNSKPKWNFHKYLIGRDGQTVTAYGSMTSPDSSDLVKQLEKLLNTQVN
jgi:glutathione peroxidase